MCGFAFSSFRLLLQTGVLLLIMTPCAMPQSPPAVKQLLDELPPCSDLRAHLEYGIRGDGIEQSYMGRMREQGVQRAELTVRAILRGGKTADIHVERRLYFRHFDGPNSQISDEATLKAIEASGLQADLDDVARSRVSAAPLFRGPGLHFWPIKRVSSFVEFFANPWLPEEQVRLFPSGHPNPSGDQIPLAGTVLAGDALGTQATLRSHRFGKKELDRALFEAVLSRYDNSTVINLLLDAGADANARTPDGTTPLMNAVDKACNLRPLLDRGADLNARNKWGQTALQIASDHKVLTAVDVLLEAGAK